MSRRFIIAFTLVLLLGAVMRAGLARVRPIGDVSAMVQRGGDEPFYVKIAHSILESGRYAEDHLRAYRPPGYPAFLATILGATGSYAAVQAIQNTLFLAAAAVFALAAARWFSPMAGLLTLLFLLLNPVWMVLPQQALSETLFIAILVGAIVLVRSGGDPGLGRIAMAGALLGVAALVREIGLYVAMATALVLVVHLRRSGARGPWAAGAILAASTILVIVPWTIRNAIVLHAFVPVTTNGPINLYVGNNPDATGTITWRIPEDVRPLWNRPGTENEMRVMRSSGSAAVAYIIADPARALRLLPTKLRYLWGPIPAADSNSSMDCAYRRVRYWHWPAYAALAVGGLWLLRRDLLGWMLLAALAVATAIHLLTFAAPIYRAPWEFLLAAPAGCAVAALLARLRAAVSLCGRDALTPVAAGTSPS